MKILKYFLKSSINSLKLSLNYLSRLFSIFTFKSFKWEFLIYILENLKSCSIFYLDFHARNRKNFHQTKVPESQALENSIKDFPIHSDTSHALFHISPIVSLPRKINASEIKGSMITREAFIFLDPQTVGGDIGMNFDKLLMFWYSSQLQNFCIAF